MSAPVVYTSDDASAPVLSGDAAGRLVNVFTKCLVDGYGAKAAAGWTKEFDDGAGIAVYRPAGGNRMYFRVEDFLPTGGQKFANVNGAEGATGHSTLTDAFPAVVSGTSGIDYSENNSVTPRKWVLVADDRTVYFFVDKDATGAYYACGFGDFYSYVSSDSYRTFLCGMSNLDGVPNIGFYHSVITDGSTVKLARNYTGLTKNLSVGLHAAAEKMGGSPGGGLGVVPYPNGPDERIWLSETYIHEPLVPAIRGKLRGLWCWLHPTSGVADRDTFSGTGAEAGKTFLILNASRIPGFTNGLFVIETSDTWATSS